MNPYFLYMAETEGIESVTSTRRTKINAVIKDFVSYHHRGYNINHIKAEVLSMHGLDENLLTDAEAAYIVREVEKRINA